MIVFSCFSDIKVCLVSLELPHRGDSNEYTQQAIINIKKRKSLEIIPNTIMSAAMGLLLLGTQERVRNCRDERAISVRASEVLLHFRGTYILCPEALISLVSFKAPPNFIQVLGNPESHYESSFQLKKAVSMASNMLWQHH